jgi:hypothetical protein
VDFVRNTIWTDLQSRAPHPENVKPDVLVKLPKRSIETLEDSDGYDEPPP